MLNKKFLMLSVFLVVLLSSFNVVLAQCDMNGAIEVCRSNSPAITCGVSDCWEGITSFITGVPEADINAAAAAVPGSGIAVLLGILWFFIQKSVLPFLAIWMIIFGFMKELRIFRRAKKVNVWLPFLIAFSLFPLHWAYPITNFLFQINGILAVAVFSLIFAVGVWRYGVAKRARWGAQAQVAAGYEETVKGLREELKEKREVMMRLTEKLSRTLSAQRRAEVEEKVTKLKDEIRSLEDRLEEMRTTFRSA